MDANKKIIYLFIILMILSLSSLVEATVFFSFDGESGYQYMGSGSPHPGGGYFSHMGGLISGPEATQCSDAVGTYHHTILSNDAAAQGAVSGSQYALKTPYRAGCPDESFLRDTTTITLAAPLQEYYMRWYQKWTGNWFEATFQKFFKPKDSGGVTCPGQFGFSINGPGPGHNSLFAAIRNIEGHFDKDGVTRNPVVEVSATMLWPVTGPGPTSMAYDDDETTTSEFVFAVNTWYCIEVHVKINTSGNSDGLMEIWVNGNKVLGIYNYKWYTGTIYGVTSFEMQHVYYDRDAIDEPTYMDNIVISDSYIGPFGSTPSSVQGLTIGVGGSISMGSGGSLII
jgi:hypothetical protein